MVKLLFKILVFIDYLLKVINKKLKHSTPHILPFIITNMDQDHAT